MDNSLLAQEDILRDLTGNILKDLRVYNHSDGEVRSSFRQEKCSVYSISDSEILVPGLLIFGGLAEKVLALRDNTSPPGLGEGLFTKASELPNNKLYRRAVPSKLVDYFPGLSELERVAVLGSMGPKRLYAAGIIASLHAARLYDINPTLLTEGQTISPDILFSLAGVFVAPKSIVRGLKVSERKKVNFYKQNPGSDPILRNVRSLEGAMLRTLGNYARSVAKELGHKKLPKTGELFL